MKRSHPISSLIAVLSAFLVTNSWAMAQDTKEDNQRKRVRVPGVPLNLPREGLIPSEVQPQLQVQPRPAPQLQLPNAEQLQQQRRERLKRAAERMGTKRLESTSEGAKRAAPDKPARERPSARQKAEETTGRLRQQLEADSSCTPVRPREAIAFNFEGDVSDLVKTVSKYTCRNFILTQKIRSQKIEILSNNLIDADDIWRAFLSALEANDISVVRAGDYWKLIQANDAIRSNVSIYGDGSDAPVIDQVVTKIWKLKYATDIDRVVNYLNVFKSAPGGQIHPYRETNTIIATDFGSIIRKLERILEEVDKPGALEQVHVVPVQYASASEIAEKLTSVFEPNSATTQVTSRRSSKSKSKAKSDGDGGAEVAGAAPETGPLVVSKILADDRTNKLIIIASSQALRQILSLMRELDLPEDGTQGQIHVVRLKHADAEELSSTLASLAQGAQPQNQGGGARRNRSQNQASTRSQGASGAALFEGEVRITADAATNSLVITASKSDFSSVQRVIGQLDVPRFQVFVEAVIMEVATTNDRTLGVGFHGGAPLNIDGEETPILFANSPSQDLSSLQSTINPLGLASLLGLAGTFRGPTLSGTEGLVPGGGIPSVGVVIQALLGQNDVNVVSTPHLLTIDNEEAEIQVNEQRPFPSGLNLGGLGALGGLAGAGGQAGQALGNIGGLGLGAVNFNREDIGLTLKLRPQINDEDYVRLEIEQELSDVAGIDQVTGQVITSNRSAQTVVVVRNQDSVVIGGLVRDRETRDESKTPLLGDIPLIGWLFKRQQKTISKVNLLLILTPYIIRGPDDFRKIFERKMEERREFVNRFYGTSVEYRANIDWDRKVGPLAAFRKRVRAEMMKAENDGPGTPGETVIRPTGTPGTEEPLDQTDAENETSPGVKEETTGTEDAPAAPDPVPPPPPRDQGS